MGTLQIDQKYMTSLVSEEGATKLNTDGKLWIGNIIQCLFFFSNNTTYNIRLAMAMPLKLLSYLPLSFFAGLFTEITFSLQAATPSYQEVFRSITTLLSRAVCSLFELKAYF